MGIVLQMNHVGKTFSLPDKELEVLKDISLDIEAGSFISIVGVSGCGKSTLLRIIAGLETTTTGEALFHGAPITEPSINIGFIFQESRLFPWLNVSDNIKFGIFNPSPDDENLVTRYAQLVGLEYFMNALPKQLSGGMQQRVSIARTLINQPEILLLDEPFGALDALTRIQMQNEIVRIRETQRTTMILVTHDIDESIFLSDKIAIMSERPGKISKIIDVELPRPRDRSSADFISIRRNIYREFFQHSNIDIEYYL